MPGRITAASRVGADLGGDPRGIEAIALGLTTDGVDVVQREAQRIKAQFVLVLAGQVEHRAIEPAAVLCQRDRDMALRIIEPGDTAGLIPTRRRTSPR